MFGEENILKDNATEGTISLKDKTFFVSYKKTNKLISALYMVTDIMDRDEPMRAKLRALGNEIVSDIIELHDAHMSDKYKKVLSNIGQILSFIDIAETVSMMSTMNAQILKKEFLALKDAVVEAGTAYKPYYGENTLSDFLDKSAEDSSSGGLQREALSADLVQTKRFKIKPALIPKGHSIGQKYRTNLGIQKPHTLLSVLGNINGHKKDKQFHNGQEKKVREFQRENRSNRVGEIIKILKDNSGGLTISDIKEKGLQVFKDISEKTIQRELVSMVERGVLKKSGTKRWSKYYIS